MFEFSKVQVLVYKLEPVYECRDMKQSMAHYWDPNALIKLDAASIDISENTDKIKVKNRRMYFLTPQILDQPLMHPVLETERKNI